MRNLARLTWRAQQMEFERISREHQAMNTAAGINWNGPQGCGCPSCFEVRKAAARAKRKKESAALKEVER